MLDASNNSTAAEPEETLSSVSGTFFGLAPRHTREPVYNLQDESNYARSFKHGMDRVSPLSDFMQLPPRKRNKLFLSCLVRQFLNRKDQD